MADDEIRINITADVGDAQSGVKNVTDSVNALNITVGEGVNVSQKMADAIQQLSSKEAIAAGTSKDLTDAWVALNAEARKAGATVLPQAAGGFEVVKTAAESAGGKVTYFEGTAANAAVRMLAMEAGLGRASYALGMLARSSGEAAPIIAAMLPGVAVVVATGLVIALIDKIDKYQEKLRDAANQSDNLAISSYKTADSLELENLKLEDQIRKLEGRPTKNRLQEALLEAKIAGDQLGTTLDSDFEKALKLLEGGIWDAIEERAVEAAKNVKNNIDIILDPAGFAAALATGQAQWSATISETERAVKEKLQPLVDQYQQARLKAAQAPPGSDALSKAYAEEEVAVKRLITATQDAADRNAGNLVLRRKMTDETIMYTNALRSLQEMEKSGVERVTLAGAGDAAEAEKNAFTIGEAKIRADQTVSDAEIKVAKQTADETLKVALDEAKNEVTAAGEKGEGKLQAELQVLPKIRAAYESHTDALIGIENEEYNKTKTRLEQELALYEKDKSGPEREAKEIEINAKLEALGITHRAALTTIAIKGNEEVNGVDAKAAGDREQIDKDEKEKRKRIDEEYYKTQVTLAGIELDGEIALYNARIPAFMKNNAEVIAQEKSFLTAKWNMVKAELDQELKQEGLTELDKQKIRDKEAIEYQKYLNKLDAEDAKSVNYRLELENGLYNAMKSSFSSSIMGMIDGSKTFVQAMGDILKSLLQVFVDVFAQILAKWIMTNIVMKIIGATSQAAAVSGQILADAYVAAAGTWATVSFLAPPPAPELAAAAAFGAVSGMAPAAAAAAMSGTAAGGAVLNSDMVIGAHAQEMILPARLSTGLQNLVETGTPTGGAAGGLNFYYAPSINAIDSSGMAAVLQRHSGIIMRQVKQALRHGSF